MQLHHLKTIVTGGANGMGRYFAEALHAAGACVSVGDVDETGLSTLPAGVHRKVLDVACPDACEEFVSWAADSMGGLNSLVNNAGIIRDGLLVSRDRTTGAIRKMTDMAFNSVLEVNLTGATVMVREVVAHMANHGATGVIVNMSSISRHGNRGQSNYVASKAALAANTLTWAREFKPFGIRVGAIAPGMVETPMTDGMHQAALEKITARIPVGRIGQPKDIWLGVKFILECDYFNGRTIDIDGGLSL